MLKRMITILLMIALLPITFEFDFVPEAQASQGGSSGWGQVDFGPLSRDEVDRLLDPGVDYYEVLGFQSGVGLTREQIKERLRELQIKYHEAKARGNPDEPDTIRTLATPAEAKELMNKILSAVNMLSDPNSKQEYDRSLRRKYDWSSSTFDPLGTGPETPEERQWRNYQGSTVEEELWAEEPSTRPTGQAMAPTEGDERVINRYLNRLRGTWRLRQRLYKAVRNFDPMVSDPNFHVALRRYLFETVESRFRPDVGYVPFIKRLVPSQWKYSDPVWSFDDFAFDLLHEYMQQLTPDRMVNLAMHLLVLDRIDVNNDPQKYYQAIGLTLGYFTDLAPVDPVDKLWDVHMSADNLLALFNDATGATALKSTKKHEPFQRRIQTAAIRRYIILNPQKDRAVSELRIRAAAVGSEIWNKLVTRQNAAQIAVMEAIVARNPPVWEAFKQDLYRLSKARTTSPYAQSEFKKLYHRLEKVNLDHQKRLQAEERRRARTESPGILTTTWRNIKRACYDLFWRYRE